MPADAPIPAPQETDSWYLDPAAARHKAEVNLSCVNRWAAGTDRGRVLKTDLFEEANGDDHLLARLGGAASHVVGIDCMESTATRAARRFSGRNLHCLTADLRALGFRDATFDFILSTSTLDHFDTRREFLDSLAELERILRPGGRMVLVLDNPWNPIYHPLKLVCRWFAPFTLGYTTSRSRFERMLEDLGLRVLDHDYLVHNPRMASTAVFFALRRVLGKRADGPVSLLLRGFNSLGRLPTRPLTACFSVVCVEKVEARALRAAAD